MFTDIVNKIAAATRSESAGKYYARPSIAGMEICERRLAYHANGIAAEPFPGRAILTFDDSSWHEELTADWFRQSIFKIHSFQMPVDLPAPGINPAGHYCAVCKKPVSPETLHGHIDWIAQDPTGKETLIEHKALSHFGFYRIAGGELPLDYLTQATIYSAALQRVQPDLKSILLLIKNKNTAQYCEIECEYDANGDELTVVRRLVSEGDAPAEITDLNKAMPNIIGEAMEKFRRVEQYKQEKKLPIRPFLVGTEYPCSYCRWGKTCWANYTEEFQNLETDAQLSEEVATLIRFYLEVDGHRAESQKAGRGFEKQSTELKQEILQVLRNKDASAGKVGPYFIEFTLHERHSLDKSKLPPDMLAMADTVIQIEKLTVLNTEKKRNGKRNRK